jgi:predicted dehydrogenase
MTIRVVVVGTGFGTRVQVPGFRAVAGVEVAAIVSGRAERAQAAARELNIPAWYAEADYARMLAEVKPDIVSIVSPPVHHAPQVLAAIEAGAHIICEKPFAMNTAEARQMLAAAERAGRIHAIDHEFRFVPARQYQKALIERGFVGDIRALEATAFMNARTDPNRAWNWWADAAQGGGMLGAIGSHYIDAFRWLTDSDVAAVSATLNIFIAERPDGAARRPVTADDSAALVLKMKNGAQGVIQLSAVMPTTYQRLGVYGSQGFVILEDDKRLSGGQLGEAAHPLEIPAHYTPADWNEANFLEAPFAMLTRKVLAAMKDGGQVTPNFADGVRVQAVLDAARQSARAARWITVED